MMISALDLKTILSQLPQMILGSPIDATRAIAHL